MRIEDDMFVSVPYRDCVELMAPERISGTWFVGLEESGFLPAGAPLPPVRVYDFVNDRFPPEGDTYLDVGWPETLELLERVPEPEGAGDTSRYSIEFIGRRGRETSQYGHGGAANLIVVDRMLSIRPAGRVETQMVLPPRACGVDDCPSS